jgi:hypothetical protein
MSDPLLPQRFLFRFAAPCLYRHPLWTAEGAALEEKYRLVNLAELEGLPSPAEVRVAWSEAGLAVAVRVAPKRQAPWCRGTRPEDSDGLQLWIDTRDVHNVHRAGRFCQRFIFLPSGGGRRQDQAAGQAMPIHRAREPAPPVAAGLLQVRSQILADGYRLEAFIPAAALAGFDPQEHRRLGFTYAILDRELGEQTFGVGSPLAYQEDPSLWPSLELVR